MVQRPVDAAEAVQIPLAGLAVLPGRLVDHEKTSGRPVQGPHQAKLFVGDKVMNGQAAPRDVGRLRPAGHRLDEVTMVELDLERHVLEIVRCKLERRLGKIDAVIVTNLGAGERAHLARIAASDVEKGEGPIEALVERVVKQRAHRRMRKLVAVDELLVGRPLSLELLQCGRIDDGAVGLKLMDEDIHHAQFPSLAAQPA